MKPEQVTRFSVSLPEKLLSQYDAVVGAQGYTNRSQAVADMIRDYLVEHHLEGGQEEIAGTITLVYDHHKPHVQEILTHLQHDHLGEIISSLHVHLDHHNCLEVLVVKGRHAEVKSMADRLIAAKGVKHGKLTVTTTGKDLPC